MALDTYANLQTAVLTWLARPGDTLISGSVPDMITLFEEEARDRMRHRLGESTTTITTTTAVATVALPSMFLDARRLTVQATPNQALVYMTPEELDTVYPLDSNEDQPVNYTIEGPNFRFGPIPNAVYTIEVDYLAGITALSNSNTTNWLLTNYPSLYLFGTLAEASMFIDVAEQDAGMWLQRRDAGIERVLLSDRKTRWPGGSLQIKTDVGNP